MKNKKTKISFIVLICITILSGCGSKGLSDNYDEDKVTEKAKEVISFINNEETDAILEISSAEMKEVMTKDTINKVYEILEEAGDFEKIESISLKEKDDFAVTIIKTKYKEKDFTYSISFNKEMELAGLYLK